MGDQLSLRFPLNAGPPPGQPVDPSTCTSRLTELKLDRCALKSHLTIDRQLISCCSAVLLLLIALELALGSNGLLIPAILLRWIRAEWNLRLVRVQLQPARVWGDVEQSNRRDDDEHTRINEPS